MFMQCVLIYYSLCMWFGVADALDLSYCYRPISLNVAKAEDNIIQCNSVIVVLR